METIVHCAYDKHSGTVFCLYSTHVTDRIKKSKYQGIQTISKLVLLTIAACWSVLEHKNSHMQQ